MMRLTNADLAEIKKRAGTPSMTEYVMQEDVPALLAEVERLRNENSLLCPIGDLDVITSLRTEKSMYMEHIAELEAEVERLQAENALLESLVTKEDPSEEYYRGYYTAKLNCAADITDSKTVGEIDVITKRWIKYAIKYFDEVRTND